MTTARLLFALAALVLVIRSVQFHDYVNQGDASYRLVRQTDAGYVVRDASGREMTLPRTPENRLHHGAIYLAGNIRVAPAVIGLLIFSVVNILLGWRWQILLRVQGVHLPLWTVIQLTYAGLLMNFFLIGTTGGDLVKAYWVGRLTSKRAEGFVSVFVDRFIGLAVLIVMAAVLVVLMWQAPQVAKLGRAVGILVVMAGVTIMFLFSRRLRKVIRFDRWKGKLPISRIIDRIDQSLLAYRRSSGSLVKAALITLVLQFLSSTASYFLGDALHINARIWYYWLYVPLAFLIGSIPISLFWGLGLLEGAYIAFFSGSGFATVTQAAMLAMAVRLMQLFWSLPGSLVLAMDVRGPAAEEAPAKPTLETGRNA